MKVCRWRDDSGLVGLAVVTEAEEVRPLRAKDGRLIESWADLHQQAEPSGVYAAVVELAESSQEIGGLLADLSQAGRILSPLDRQEVWAAGVTYWRSREARMEESDAAANLYDRVYEAERPEIFFKATARRVVGPGQAIGVRGDSNWTVPEPELALLLGPNLELLGFTICNDVSARDIEGANPLYLPQAKIYDGSCAVGPVVWLMPEVPARPELRLQCTISRQGVEVFHGGATTAQLKRSLPELVAYLGRYNSFPDGVLLSTGTCIVPPDDFSLQTGDLVEIDIEGIGRLSNPVRVLD